MQDVDELKRAAATLLTKAIQQYRGDYGSMNTVEALRQGSSTMTVGHDGTISVHKDGVLRVRMGSLVGDHK